MTPKTASDPIDDARVKKAKDAALAMAGLHAMAFLLLEGLPSDAFLTEEDPMRGLRDSVVRGVEKSVFWAMGEGNDPHLQVRECILAAFEITELEARSDSRMLAVLRARLPSVDVESLAKADGGFRRALAGWLLFAAVPSDYGSLGKRVVYFVRSTAMMSLAVDVMLNSSGG